jgi:hypothetical protein
VPEEDEAGGVRGIYLQFSKSSGTLLKTKIFLLLQRSNEKVLNMKVVEFFKLYNIALRLGFKILKGTVLF